MSVTIVITVGGVDITDKVLFATASFESQMAAIPGSFELTVKDDDQDQSFTTGDEVTLDIDGVRLFGGYVTQITPKFAFPVVDTGVVADVTARQFVLRGVDYNILFDKRVLRNTADFLHHLPFYPEETLAGDIVEDIASNYIDVPAGFNVTAEVDPVVDPSPDRSYSPVEQGSKWRAQMEDLARWGAVYYLNATKFLIFKAVEDSEAKWAFSDKPNRLPIPSGYSYKPTIGFREGEFTEDGTLIVNDALVWGGSEWSEGIVFARRQSAASIAEHGRWQIAETHFGRLKSQAQVDARANVIVDGTVSGTSGNLTRGLVNPQRTARVTWFDRNVPADPNEGGDPSHLRPGDVMDFILYTLGEDEAHPLIMTLPLRTVRISFPGLDPDGLPYAKFEGYFGLQLSDPWWLWKYLRDRDQVQTQGLIAIADDSTTGGIAYGTKGVFTPSPAPDGSTTVFTIPFSYISGTTEVYRNGIRFFTTAGYTESDPPAGEITFTDAPETGDELVVVARLTGG